MAYLPQKTFNVDTFGARGDGVTNDTSAIASGLLAATGAILTCTPGRTYIVSGALSIPNNTYLQGYGATIKAPIQSAFEFFQLYGKTGCRIEGLTFDGTWTNAAAQNNAMIDLSTAANIDIKDCTFRNVSSECIRLLGGCTRINISDNRFTGFAVGIFADDDGSAAASDIIVSRNQFHGANSSAAGTAAIKFAGLSTNNINSHAGLIISDNVIVRPGEMGIELQTWFNDSTVANNSIEQGEYGISIDGCARAAINSNVIRGCAFLGIEVSNSADVTIDGCIVDGTTGAGVSTMDEGIFINLSSGCAVNGCVVRDATRDFYVVGGHHVTIAGCTIKAGANTAGGMLLKGCSDTIVDGNMFWATTTAAVTQDMLAFASTDIAMRRIAITNNVFGGNIGRYGIFLLGDVNVIEDVTIAGNNTAGAYAATAMYTNQVYNGGSNRRIRVYDNIGSGDQSFNNAINLPIWSGASNLILDERYQTVNINASAAARVVTLPTASGANGVVFTINKVDSSANPVQIVSTGGQLINTQTGQFLTAQFSHMSLMGDGYNWSILQSGVS